MGFDNLSQILTPHLTFGLVLAHVGGCACAAGIESWKGPWKGLEGTFKAHPVQPPWSEQGHLQLD